jgi:hypothetical protein
MRVQEEVTMPIDSALKAQHVLDTLQRTFEGRQKTVVLVIQASGGSFTYVAIQAIMRSQQVIEPEIPTVTGLPPRLQFDTLLVAPLTVNFIGALYVADTVTASAAAVAVAQKYEIVEVLPVGLVAGGSHYSVRLRRLR